MSLSITTDRLLLRPVCLADLGGFVALESDPGAYSGGVLGAGPSGQASADPVVTAEIKIQRLIDEEDRERGIGSFAIISEGQFIGRASLRNPLSSGRPSEPHITYLSVFLLESARGKGLGSEAATAVVEWGLGCDGVVGVGADVNPANTKSQTMLLKAGMQQVGEWPDGNMLIYMRLAPGQGFRRPT